MFKRFSVVLTVLCFFIGTAWAAPSTSIFVNPANTVPGVVANTIQADGQGYDWTGGVLKIDLITGSVYNIPTFGADHVQDILWSHVPELEFDSWVGVPGLASNGIAGGAGDLGGGPQNLGGTGIDAASITWFDASVSQIGINRIANISLTDDAAGTWALITRYALGPQLQSSGVIVNGVMVPEPASLSFLGLGGLVWLRRG